MKSAVIFGAGNIGRGFIGQLFCQSGYEVTFIEVNQDLVGRLNRDKQYPVRFVSDEGDTESLVGPVSAVSGLDVEASAEAIAKVDLAATAVGVNVLPRIAPTLARGLAMRWASGNRAPLNILICENLIHGDQRLREAVRAELAEDAWVSLDTRVGFVEASIGRMVPVMTAEAQEGNPLRVCTELYSELPVDRNGFVGVLPDLQGMTPFSPFTFHIHRKLFIHNLGHAVAAYLGACKGCRHVWEAVRDPEIRAVCRGAMLESSRALSLEHGVEQAELIPYVDGLLSRFGNRKLGDTVERVGREPERKLMPDDRLVGALRLCLKHGIEPICILFGLSAALEFRMKENANKTMRAESLEVETILKTICGLEPDTWEWESVLGFVRASAARRFRKNAEPLLQGVQIVPV